MVSDGGIREVTSAEIIELARFEMRLRGHCTDWKTIGDRPMLFHAEAVSIDAVHEPQSADHVTVSDSESDTVVTWHH